MKPIMIASMAVLLVPATALAQPAKIGSTPKGAILQTEAGKTLYVFDGDDIGSAKSNCNKSCAALWQPLAAEGGAQASGDWSIVTREDGSKQWAYKGRPLYTWVKDKAPGQKNGNSFEGNTWHVAKP